MNGGATPAEPALPSRIATPPARAARRLRALLPWVTAAWIFVQLLSLRLNLLRRFFFDTLYGDVQATDFFSLPKAWLSLRSGHSLFATFDPPAYGPHFTWYLAHPALALVLGGPLSRPAPMDSYGLFTLLSLAVLAACAALLASQTTDPLQRQSLWLLMLGSFPGYLMLWVGNVQAFTVLGLTLLLSGLRRLQRGQQQAGLFLRAGLLLSLFTKPVVLLSLPLLLLLRETRRWALQATALYLSLSLVCEVVPALNPEAIGLRRVGWLAVHPAFVRASMNIYRNGLQLTPDMRDNSVHWFNLIAQSGLRLQHIDVYSLPVFLDGLLGRSTPGWLYLLPPLLVFGLSFAVARIPDTRQRHETALLLTMAASLDVFLSFPTVWEYQYTAVLPVVAVLLIAGRGTLLSGRAWRWALAAGGCCAWLPSLYCLSSGRDTPGALTLARLDRVLPVSLLFVLLVWAVLQAVGSRARGSAPVAKRAVPRRSARRAPEPVDGKFTSRSTSLQPLREA